MVNHVVLLISGERRHDMAFAPVGPSFALGRKGVWVKTVLGSHFGVGAPPILANFSGDWDVR